MKRFLLSTLLIVAAATFASGQTYNFQVNNGTYTDLSGATSLNQGQVWDDPEYILPLGFSFPFGAKTYDTLYVTDGTVGLNFDQDTIIAPYLSDMIDRGDLTGISVSSINYKTDMIGGVQVMKLEYNNFGFFEEYDSLGTLDWYGNVQLWLYANGKWEVHIGPNFIPQPLTAFFWGPGPSIGYGNIMTNYWLTGNAAGPSLTLNTSPVTLPSLGSVPANGTIYSFTPIGTGINKTSNKNSLAAYPNPFEEELLLVLPEDGKYEIFDITGKCLLTSANLSAGSNQAEVGQLADGIYTVVFTSLRGERSTARIVKK